MSTLPLPVRVAVGLAVTAVEQARKLPEQLSDLPVTAASRAVQAAMRVQQRVTELAIKGDQVCALFRPVEDTTSWARFDEDDEPATASGSGQGAGVVPGAGHGTTVTRDGEVDEADVARAMTSAAPSATGGPPALPDYDVLSLAQLRARLRALSLAALTELLDYEHGHQDRAAFITLLSNRISTVRSQATEAQ